MMLDARPRRSEWRPGPRTRRESWSRNGEACLTGLNPPFAGGVRLANSLTLLLRTFVSRCRSTHDATGALAFACTGSRPPSTLAWSMSLEFDLALLDPALIRDRVRRRGGDPAACRWPTVWLEGSVDEYSMGRDPFPPVGTVRRKVVLLAEEGQVFVPARAVALGAPARRKWGTGLDAVGGVSDNVAEGLIDGDERAFLVNLLVLVHTQPVAGVRPRPPLEESYRRHEGSGRRTGPARRGQGSARGVARPVEAAARDDVERAGRTAVDAVSGRFVRGGRAAVGAGGLNHEREGGSSGPVPRRSPWTT
ncbi:MAG: hypothetical protein QME96_07805 [Myxococcota bacterium]|nr:hypothetical protein [Myxococcota bacterium]